MVFTPKDFGLNDIMGEMVGVIREARGLAPLESAPA
jgi:(2R)-ethylmalonyl-CoA mutase